MSFFFGRSNSNGDSGKNNNNPSNSSNDSNTNNPSPVNLKENQAQVLLNTAQQAYNNGNLDDALTFYTESIQLYLEVYKIEADNNKKALLYHTMEETMVRAENIKRQIRERDQVIAAAQEIAKANNSTISSNVLPLANPSALKPSANDSTTPKPPKTSRRDPSTKPLPLPDDYDFSAPKKPLSNAPKRAATPTGKTTATGAAKKATGATTTNNTSATTGGAAKAEVQAPKTNEYTSQIMEEILDKSPEVRWDDIAGLSFAKQTLQEAVILPNLRPDLFTGLRKPPKGVLLFGPPGTGKTLLAKAVATESGFVFFSISASSVTSKYLGEGEKLIKALFDLAREKQPSVIFIDEIDSLMSARKDNEHEASRRLKTEFMTQMDGAASTGEDRILVMGATNIPWDIDEAVLRRMAKRIYVPLPDVESRKALIIHLLKKQGPSAGHITSRELDRIVNLTEGYSGSDLAAVCSEAALGPIREIGPAALKTVKVEEVRPINLQDFVNALKIIRPSVSGDSLKTFQRWAEQFGVTR